MHHLFLGLPVAQVGLASYATAKAPPWTPEDLGRRLTLPVRRCTCCPTLRVCRADHVAMLPGVGDARPGRVVLGLHIGTNTEISLITPQGHFACSTASGPAFEGAHIRHGIGAVSCAIEKVLIYDGQIKLQTIDISRLGLCGSGILDLIARCVGLGFSTIGRHHRAGL